MQNLCQQVNEIYEAMSENILSFCLNLRKMCCFSFLLSIIYGEVGIQLKCSYTSTVAVLDEGYTYTHLQYYSEMFSELILATEYNYKTSEVGLKSYNKVFTQETIQYVQHAWDILHLVKLFPECFWQKIYYSQSAL